MANARESITLDELWEKISNNIDTLFQCQTIRYSNWMQVYTYIFNYCTETNSNKDDLYKSLRDYLKNHLENLSESFNDLHEQNIIECYIKQWHKYRRSSKILHGICSYLHRFYISHERDIGNLDIHEIYHLALQMWHEIISKLSYEKMITTCLIMIRSEREQQKIDIDLIRNIIEIYVTLDINQQMYHRGEDDDHSLRFYKEYFEDRFLNDTKNFYRLQVNAYLQQYSIMDYLRKITDYFHEEIHRVSTYLHSSTVPKLINTLENILIHDQLSAINAEAKNLISHKNIEELNLIYRTINRIENGTAELKNLLENHIYHIAIERIKHIPTNASDLKMYIQTNADLHEEYQRFIEKVFHNDQSFLHILDRTFQKFVNDNEFIQNTNGTTTLAQSLAYYCDRLLRKKQNEQTDLETIFQQMKILLHYMEEKDTFEKFYSKLLAKRLITQKSISNDYEKSMILTIQSACGLEYVTKMIQMCQDIETSEHLSKKYSQTEHLDHQIDFHIVILNSNAWLFSVSSTIILPNQLEMIFNHFTKFYQQMYSGKKLTWLHQHSKGELQISFTEKLYTLQVSMYQMIILLLFNISSKWTLENIHEQTQIKMNLLLQTLRVLLRSKILICAQGEDQIEFDFNSTITLADEFHSDKYYINLNIPMTSIKENDEEVFQKKINQDRIIAIQAAIVRIMKSHQMMNQNFLIQTVIEQLNSRFRPDITMIKECISMLIKREYLERSSQNFDLLCYMN